ncbi:MAG: hypothetical protein VB957_14125 [Pseudomonadales bacterium]
MKRQPGITFSVEQKTFLWGRWQKGDSVHASAAHFDRQHTSVSGILAKAGGIH